MKNTRHDRFRCNSTVDGAHRFAPNPRQKAVKHHCCRHSAIAVQLLNADLRCSQAACVVPKDNVIDGTQLHNCNKGEGCNSTKAKARR